MSDPLTLAWDQATVIQKGKRKKASKNGSFSKDLADGQRAARAAGKGADAVAKAVAKGLEAWNEAFDQAEAEGDDGPVRRAVDIWAAGASATLEGLAKAPTRVAKAWDRPIKVKRLRRAAGGMMKMRW